ncbi:hypothetical protein [Rheinheimera sp. WS51]|uniref:hypothetical protein n=1 Tax=Rheinheimera sp. WS51 TaxID=3425886 RepID=UPI003D906BC3
MNTLQPFDLSKQQNITTLAQEPDNFMSSEFNLLFMGNSHSSSHNLPQLVAKLIKTDQPNAQVHTKLASGYHFLDERLQHRPSTNLLRDGNWSHVILQAQKYSTTGKYFYPTDAAEEWIKRINSKNSQAIMFPEWPRRGNKEEAARIHQLHIGIAKAASACVAPIGLAWQLALQQNPKLKLHSADGNHSNLDGAFLTALVLYGTITKNDPSKLNAINGIKVSINTQTELKRVASATLLQHAACFTN